MAAGVEPAGWGAARRRAFYVGAALLALLLGVTFVGVTALTIGLWVARQNADTNPVLDLSFFALGGVLIATGLAVQLRAPERHIAGLQQAALGLLALGVAGLIGRRIEPLSGAVLFLAATALLAALHPARRRFFRVDRHPSLLLAALALLAALRALPYAAAMLAQARQAGQSCFLGRCAGGDRFAEMAALALALVAAALLAAVKPDGWRVTAWCVGVAATTVGAASLVWPDLPGSLGQADGLAAVAWGVLFAVGAVWEARRMLTEAGATEEPTEVGATKEAIKGATSRLRAGRGRRGGPSVVRRRQRGHTSSSRRS